MNRVFSFIGAVFRVALGIAALAAIIKLLQKYLGRRCEKPSGLE